METDNTISAAHQTAAFRADIDIMVQAIQRMSWGIVTIRWSDNRVTACGWMQTKNLADLTFWPYVPQLRGFIQIASTRIRAGHSAVHAVSPKTFINAFKDLPQ